MSATTDTVNRFANVGANVALEFVSNPWPVLIAKYGIIMAVELAEILSKGGDPTVDELRQLQLKYGTKSPDDFLRESAERLGIVTTS